MYLHREGESMYTFYLPEWKGVNPDTGLGEFWKDPNDHSKGVVNKYDEAEKGIVGKAIPDVTGGLTNTFRLYDFDLSFLITYQFGGDIFDYPNYFFHHDGFRLFDTDEFSTAQSKNGKDILALLSASCTKYNMNMGLYLSPWDVFEEKGKSIVYGERGAYGNGSGSTDSSPLDDDYNILYEKHLREIFDNPKYWK